MVLGALTSAARSIDRRLATRAILVVAAYAAAALVMLATVMAVRAHVSAAQLRDLLAYFFVSSLAFGLDPGTSKAAALNGGAAQPASMRSYLLVSALKGLFLAPVLALVWRISDPHAPGGALIWVVGMGVAGPCVSNLRVMLDLEGRHATATGFKQGVHSGGHLTAGLVLLGGASFESAIALATLVQIGLVGLTAMTMARRYAGPVWDGARALLTNLRWADFAGASALGAASGSVDRVFGLRFLPAADYSVYFLTFEGLMRFWLIPYLLTPIIFARSVGGLPSQGLIRRATSLILLAGVLLVAALAAAMALIPGVVAQVVGHRLPVTALLFAVGVVVLALVQIRLTQLQAAGLSRRTLVIQAISGVFAVIVFFVAATRFGLAGMMAAWAIRAAFDLGLAFSGGLARVRPLPQQPPVEDPAEAPGRQGGASSEKSGHGRGSAEALQAPPQPEELELG